MTIEVKKLLREVFLVGYTIGRGKDKLRGAERKHANKSFDDFIETINNYGKK